MESSVFVEGLRRVADWYEEHPDCPLPKGYSDGVFSNYVNTKDEVVEAKDRFGVVAVEADEYYFSVFKSFGNFQMKVFASRSTVCKRKVVGTKKVWKKEATQWTEKEVEEEIVEWDCPPELVPEPKKVEEAVA